MGSRTQLSTSALISLRSMPVPYRSHVRQHHHTISLRRLIHVPAGSVNMRAIRTRTFMAVMAF